MKYKGRELRGPKTGFIAIPRDGENGINDIIFQLKAAQELDEFDEILAPPQPPMIIKPGGTPFQNRDDSNFQKQLGEWSHQKMNWMILKTLEDTEGLEWESVKMDDPETWENFRTELKDSGFNRAEITTIINGALAINSIDEAKMEEARERFLAQTSQTQKL